MQELDDVNVIARNELEKAEYWYRREATFCTAERTAVRKISYELKGKH